MEYRTLGKTGFRVSAIGMGCWAIGGDAWGPVEDRDSIAAIKRALELGVNFFDTADVYGRGRSERLLARGLLGRRQDAIVATKVGLWRSGPDRPNAYAEPKLVVESCEQSLERLQTDYIDVYQCHLWWDENTEVFLEAFDALKSQGKIRASGLSTNQIDHVRHFNQSGTCDVLQFDYSILNRSPETDILPYCEKEQIGTIVRGPLKMGMLTGKFTPNTTFPEGDIRRPWPEQDWYRESLEKVERLRALSDGRSMAQAALQFVLRHPAVHTAIPGAKTVGQVEANAAAADGRLTDRDLELIEAVAPAGHS